MNNLENKIEERLEQKSAQWEKHRCMGRGPASSSGRIWTGIFILIVGVAALLKSFLLPLPAWLFTWQMLLIVLGLFIGLRHNFRGGAWFVLMLIGGVFLLNEFFPDLIDNRFIWPLALIVLGLFLIFKPRRRNWNWREYPAAENREEALVHFDDHASPDEDLLDSTSVFGGIKKTIISKNFRGGEVVNILGGTELNLAQADIQGRTTLEVTQIFGGTKIIVPPHWDVKPEMAAIFGGIDDKRRVQSTEVDKSKVLVLKGTSVFGGIEVVSH